MKFFVRPYQSADYEPLREIVHRRHVAWFPGKEPNLYGPDDPNAVAAVVAVDEKDRPVAYLSARKIVEIGGTIAEDVPIPDSVEMLKRVWTSLGAELIRRGYGLALARIHSPTPKFGNMLKKRVFFRESKGPHYYFDLEAVAKRLKRP